MLGPAPVSSLPPSDLSWLRRQARRLLDRRARAHMDSADAVQEVQLRALRNRPRFPDRARRRGWMKRVLRNLLASEGRRRDPVDFVPDSPDPRDPAGGPSAVARRREDSGYARELLRVLSERDRRVVELRVQEGRPFAEVAADLGLRSEGHARVIFQRAMAKLRERGDRRHG